MASRVTVAGVSSVQAAPTFRCDGCSRSYNHRKSLSRHQRLECGKEAQFSCPFCPYRAKQPNNVKLHMYNQHSDKVLLDRLD
ncbi:hypothetical protein J6590_014824 [Homalodisca vitripennis]|nr:hypothetical protein J6590_014824 [Homalodisca vitripennis]